jgi:hypothetical protein
MTISVMRSLSRFTVAVLILVFAAGTFVQAAALSKADMPMAMSPEMGEEMPGCDDCSDDPDAAMACVAACALPALGLQDASLQFGPPVRVPLKSASARAMVGELRAPDPYPPRLSFPN